MKQAVPMALDDDLDPRNWRLEVDQGCIDLYRSIHDEPRALTAEECSQMIQLVDAWRGHEQRKHVALVAALEVIERGPRS